MLNTKVPLYVLMFMIMLFSLTFKTILLENRVLVLRALGVYRTRRTREEEEEEELTR